MPKVSHSTASTKRTDIKTPSRGIHHAFQDEASGNHSLNPNRHQSIPAEEITRTEGEERFVTRAVERRTIDLNTGVRWELLTPTTREPVGFREIVYPVGAGSDEPGSFVRHSGREYGLLLSGVLHVQFDFEEYVLGPGDSITFDSTVPHRFWNSGTETVRAVWCTVESTPVEACAF